MITTDVNMMKRKFSSLLERIWNSIDDFRGTLAFLLEMDILSEEDVKQVKEAPDINEVRIVLAQKYWSFLDYENLEHIVNNKCGDTEQNLMKEYRDELERFCDRRVTEFPPGSLNNGTDHAGMKKLVVKLDLNDPSLKRIKNLKVTIARILGCLPSKLVLLDIENGSVSVTFLVVVSVGAELFGTISLTSEQEDALKEEYVVSLKYESAFVFNIDTVTEVDIHEPSELHHTCHQKGTSAGLIRFAKSVLGLHRLHYNLT